MKDFFTKVFEGLGLGTTWICTIEQTQETLQTAQLILAIVGTIVSITLALISFFRKANEDGKITADEVEQGINIVKNGAEEIKNTIEESKKNDK